jgi:hypothetical protein
MMPLSTRTRALVAWSATTAAAFFVMLTSMLLS